MTHACLMEKSIGKAPRAGSVRGFGRGSLLYRSVLLLMAMGGLSLAQAFEVVQEFKPECSTRGNVNLIPVQPIDQASWIWLGGVRAAQGDYTPFVRFRKDFTAAGGEPLRFDVSADSRFVLLLDGREIARGPHNGVENHWYYQSYAVTGLADGSHRLEAVVFDLGWKGARSLLSSGRNGFVLKAEGAYDAQLTTGKATWRAAEVKTIRTGRVTDPETMTGAETISTGTGFVDSVPEDFRDVFVVKAPLRVNEYGSRPPGWSLFPTERPDQRQTVRTSGAIRAVQSVFADKERRYASADAADGRRAALQALLKDGRSFTVPARTKLRFLWDLEDYFCAYPNLDVSGGRGARVCWKWTEGLYDDAGTRGNRDAFLGKRVTHSMDDTFLCDGRADAKFSTPWWRSGRWVEIAVETADEPLVLTRLALVESRYPLDPSMRFACDDPTLADVQRICVRGLQNCLHEMFMDCPYFEQQMYPGDTRVEMLILSAISGDDRPLRYGTGIFDYARRDDGMVPMNFPSRAIQDSSTYSMCWVMMAGDYVRWHGTNAWLRARLPGLRHTMSVLEQSENSEGLVENLPGWSFMDWVPEWDFYGNAPDGRRGLSALNNLLYVHALQSLARTEAALGNEDFAACWRAKAARTGAAIVRRFWSASRGMLADTVRHDVFSEHAQCLALLADLLPPDKAASAFRGLLEAKDLARTTVYFSHYLFETYLKFGRADLFLKRLDLWRTYVKDGLKTPLEAPGVRARSDCHAWGAHPLLHLITGVAGVAPDSDAYATVRIAPQPGGLRFIRATAPTPRGPVDVDFRFADGKVSGSVTLPAGLTGSFVWNGHTHPLSSGRTAIPVAAPALPRGETSVQPIAAEEADGTISLCHYRNGRMKLSVGEVEVSEAKDAVKVRLTRTRAGKVRFRVPAGNRRMTVCNDEMCLPALDPDWVEAEAKSGSSDWEIHFGAPAN